VEVALLAVALAFAVVNGLNDGGALLAVGLGVRGLAPWTALLALTGAVVVAPALLGTRVAATLAGRLVRFDGPEGQAALLVAIIVAVLVSTVLAERGLPTSLTLAVVGAIAGAGLGSGLPVSWGTVGVVLTLAALAPVVGAVVAWLLTHAAAWWPSRRTVEHRVRRWHPIGFGLQCLAYGLNDGQKMLAVIAVAAGTLAADAGKVPLVPWQLAAVAACFLLGTLAGLPRVAATLGGGVVPVRPPAAAMTEVASAGVVLATGLLGSPVSMTQAISGSLVGTGMVSGAARVRWREAARLLLAWVVTLPAAVVAAAAAAAVASALT
jgi:inorganic phosphate transporter, PiT family